MISSDRYRPARDSCQAPDSGDGFPTSSRAQNLVWPSLKPEARNLLACSPKRVAG
jgi:hypothetical protein